MNQQEKVNAAWWHDWAFFDAGGSAIVEFALVAPFLILLALGIADFGTLFNNYQALAAATRIGAEYARDNPTCQNSATGISTLANPPTIGSACTTAIQSAMNNSIYFSPALTYPSSCPPATSWPGVTCQCDDGTAINCGQSCATAGRPAPNRVFVAVCANQTFAPLTPWPAVTLQTITELRIQ